MIDDRDFPGKWQGFGVPHTARGIAAAYGPPPWRMSGRAMSVWYRLAEPEEVLRQVPANMEMDSDPVLRATFWDLQHDAGLPDLVDEVGHSFSFQEASLAFPVRAYGRTGDNTVYMYANDARYIAFGREVMGWPVQGGDVRLEPQGMNPRDAAPGDRRSGSLWAFGRCVMRMNIELRSRVVQSDAESPPPQWITQKVVPSVEDRPASLNEVVLTAPSKAEMTDAWDCSATLEMHEAPGHELQYLQPREILSARYWEDVQLTLGFGKVLRSFLA